MVFVQLDARVTGVDLPAHLRRQIVVGLNLSFNFRTPVFEVDDEGVRASLSFQGQRHLCVLPWDALFSFTPADTDESYVFPESAPPEIRDRLVAAMEADAAVRPLPSAPPAPPTPPPSRFGGPKGVVSAVKADAEADVGDDEEELASEPPSEPPPPPPPRGRPQLRLVK